jgi:hypothetical protein
MTGGLKLATIDGQQTKLAFAGFKTSLFLQQMVVQLEDIACLF